jgi:hypothetical protein
MSGERTSLFFLMVRARQIGRDSQEEAGTQNAAD